MAVSAIPGRSALTFSDHTLTLLALIAIGIGVLAHRVRDLRCGRTAHAAASPEGPSGWTTRSAECWMGRREKIDRLEQAVRTLNKTDKRQQALDRGQRPPRGAAALRRVRGRGGTALVLVRDARRPRHAAWYSPPSTAARRRASTRSRSRRVGAATTSPRKRKRPSGRRSRRRPRRWRPDDLQEGRGRRDRAGRRGSARGAPGRGSGDTNRRDGKERQMADNGEVTVVGVGARLDGNVVSAGSLRIDGQVKGQINADGDVDALATESGGGRHPRAERHGRRPLQGQHRRQGQGASRPRWPRRRQHHVEDARRRRGRHLPRAEHHGRRRPGLVRRSGGCPAQARLAPTSPRPRRRSK